MKIMTIEELKTGDHFVFVPSPDRQHDLDPTQYPKIKTPKGYFDYWLGVRNLSYIPTWEVNIISEDEAKKLLLDKEGWDEEKLAVAFDLGKRYVTET